MKNTNDSQQEDSTLRIHYSTSEYAISQGWLNCQDLEAIDKARALENIVVTYDNNNTITNVELPKIPKEIKKSWKGFTKKNFLKSLEDFINKYDLKIQILDKNNNVVYSSEQNNKLLPTPRILIKLTQGKEQNIKLGTYYQKSKLAIADLTIFLKKFAPDIYNEKLTKCTKKELEDFILSNSEQIITYINGAYLNILEDRGFIALRYLLVEAFNKHFINSPDQKFTAKKSDIYKLAGVPYTKGKGYDTNQRLAIKNAITNPEGALRKAIHIEYEQNHKDGNAILSTSFIKYLNWNDEKGKVTFQIDSMFFANFENKPDYYPDDVIGRNRLMNSTDGGFRNTKLYKLHQYIASSLIDKLPFNVITLLERSGLITYVKKGNKTKALSTLQEYLDLMYEQKTLLKNKPVKTSSKTDKYGKYELERL